MNVGACELCVPGCVSVRVVYSTVRTALRWNTSALIRGLRAEMNFE